MPLNSIVEQVESLGLKKILAYLDADPDKNIPVVINWVERFDREGVIATPLRTVKNVVNERDSNIWYQYLKSLYTDIDEGVRKKLFENLLINASIIGYQRQKKLSAQHQCNIPFAILMDPTSACNMRCKGCWAADYGHQLSMSYETLDRIIEQGKELGTYLYIFSGGEPLMRKDDILKLCTKHNDCVFLAFTNGTLIDEAFAEDMLRVKNFVPAISIEGFEDETDFRRGKGAYRRAVQAMEILKNKKLPFGVSCCYTRTNTHVIGSEEYFDDIVSKGAKFAWFFTYIPVGVNAHPELMVEPEQREFMYRQIRKFRKTKPIFTIDFWNDGDYINGCIAGGRKYLHISANGDIEPCAFIHYSDSSIYEKTILEACKSPLFMQYYQHQPFNTNHLRPCPLLDNPHCLEQMVTNSGAKSTEVLHPEDVHSLCQKCKEVSEKWAITADRLWQESHPGIKH